MEMNRSSKRGAVDQTSVPAAVGRAASEPPAASRRRTGGQALKRPVDDAGDGEGDMSGVHMEDDGGDVQDAGGGSGDANVDMSALYEDADMSMLSYLEEQRDRTIRIIAEVARKEGNPRPVCEEPDPMDQDSYWELFVDDISGKSLNTILVQEARNVEI